MARTGRKSTVKELEKRIGELSSQIEKNSQSCEVLAQMLNSVLENLNSMAEIVISDLVDRGKMVAVICESCEKPTHLPVGLGIEPSEVCAFCGQSFEGGEEE